MGCKSSQTNLPSNKFEVLSISNEIFFFPFLVFQSGYRKTANFINIAETGRTECYFRPPQLWKNNFT